jgi:hypothetical protein
MNDPQHRCSTDNAMTSSHVSQPRIARVWRGRTSSKKADEYARYLYEQGIKPLEQKALGVQLLREDRATESEFVTISYWESVEAMSRFAGDDPRRIHHLERDPEFLIELPSKVRSSTSSPAMDAPAATIHEASETPRDDVGWDARAVRHDG